MNHTLVPYRFEGAENKHHFTDLYPISKTGQEKSLSLEPASMIHWTPRDHHTNSKIERKKRVCLLTSPFEEQLLKNQ